MYCYRVNYQHMAKFNLRNCPDTYHNERLDSTNSLSSISHGTSSLGTRATRRTQPSGFVQAPILVLSMEAEVAEVRWDGSP
jgi:hypothetical protein